MKAETVFNVAINLSDNEFLKLEQLIKIRGLEILIKKNKIKSDKLLEKEEMIRHIIKLHFSKHKNEVIL